MRLSRMLLPTLLLFLTGPVASAPSDQWKRQLSQTLCSTPCAGQWHSPQVAPDGHSVTVAETRGAVTSLWKFSWGEAAKKVLIYQGPVLLWTLDLAPVLLVLTPEYTLLSYNINQNKVIWSRPVAMLGSAPTSLTPLIPGRILALTNRPGINADHTELRDSRNGDALQTDPRFQVQLSPSVPQQFSEPRPSADLKAKERVQQGSVAAQLGHPVGNGGDAVRLDVYQFITEEVECVACGFNK